jgi:hypothetical protein
MHRIGPGQAKVEPAASVEQLFRHSAEPFRRLSAQPHRQPPSAREPGWATTRHAESTPQSSVTIASMVTRLPGCSVHAASRLLGRPAAPPMSPPRQECGDSDKPERVARERALACRDAQFAALRAQDGYSPTRTGLVIRACPMPCEKTNRVQCFVINTVIQRVPRRRRRISLAGDAIPGCFGNGFVIRGNRVLARDVRPVLSEWSRRILAGYDRTCCIGELPWYEALSLFAAQHECNAGVV